MRGAGPGARVRPGEPRAKHLAGRRGSSWPGKVGKFFRAGVGTVSRVPWAPFAGRRGHRQPGAVETVSRAVRAHFAKYRV